MTALPPHPAPIATENALLTGDCVPLLDRLPEGSIDLTVTSPPYDDMRRYDTPADLDLLALGKALLRVTKEGGVCAVIIGDASHGFAKSLTSFRLALSWCDQAHWRLFETCLYQRHGVPGPWWRTRFRVDHEYVFLFFKGSRPKTFRKDRLLIPTQHGGERVFYRPFAHKDASARKNASRRPAPTHIQAWQCRGTVWPYAPSSSERNQLKLQHPATMPDKLAADLIEGFSEPGELVLDPLMGSGTSVVMAANLGRRYLGMDVSPAYVQIAQNRLMQEATLKTAQNAYRPPVAPDGRLDG